MKCYSKKGSFFYELRASHCSDMNVKGFELREKKKDRVDLQGVIMVRPGVKSEGCRFEGYS